MPSRHRQIQYRTADIRHLNGSVAELARILLDLADEEKRRDKQARRSRKRGDAHRPKPVTTCNACGKTWRIRHTQITHLPTSYDDGAGFTSSPCPACADHGPHKAKYDDPGHYKPRRYTVATCEHCSKDFYIKTTQLDYKPKDLGHLAGYTLTRCPHCNAGGMHPASYNYV